MDFVYFSKLLSYNFFNCAILLCLFKKGFTKSLAMTILSEIGDNTFFAAAVYIDVYSIYLFLLQSYFFSFSPWGQQKLIVDSKKKQKNTVLLGFFFSCISNIFACT